jgi:hypothetical protein
MLVANEGDGRDRQRAGAFEVTCAGSRSRVVPDGLRLLAIE